MFTMPEKYRIKDPRFYGDDGCGVFFYKQMKIIASNGGGFEHVSVSCKTRCPRWNEMCQVKDLFWDDEDLVIQYHPPKSEYVNCHPYVLHLWRKGGTNDYVELPPKVFV